MNKHIEIENKKGRILRGYLNKPSKAKSIVVFLHGYTGNKTEHNGHFREFSRLLAKENIASLRMDYSCNGESDGNFRDFLFTDALLDAKLMIDFAFKVKGIEEVSLLGFSMGGLIASLLCNYKPFKQILLWSPSDNLYEKVKRQYELLPKLENGNGYQNGFEISKGLVASMKEIDAFKEVKHFNKPVLVIHGRNDKAVDYKVGEKYAKTYPKGKLIIIESANHGYDRFSEVKELFSSSLVFLK